MMRLRPSLRLFGGASIAVSGVLLAVMACGPGDLHRLMEGDGAAATEPPPDPCKHAAPPSAPTKQDDQKSFNLTFATDNMRMDTGKDPDSGLSKPQSLDLDNTCSCGPGDAAPSCEAPSGSGVQCDKDEQGRDNVTGGLLQVAFASLPEVVGSDGIYSNIHHGFYAVLINIAAWNGTDTDDQVGVAMFMSSGVNNEKDDAANLIPPQFDGNDVWKIEEGSVRDGHKLIGQTCDFPAFCQPVALDAYAYVSKGKLVAHFDTVPFAFGQGGTRITIPFNSAVLNATLSGTEPNFKLDGELAGRWPAESILKAIANVAIVDDQTGKTTAICNQGAGYELFHTAVCKAADLAPTKDDDGQGKRCSSLSQALRFTATPAKLGPIAESTAELGSGVCPPNLDTTCPK